MPNGPPPDEFLLDMEASSSDFEDLIYLISHDVRNSVRALIELPQWIREDLVEAGIKVEGSVSQHIDLMNRHTGRLDRMLVDLLSFSRVGRVQDDRQIDLRDALVDVLEEMRIPSGFTVRNEVPAHVFSMGERDALTLLTQLVANAVKHHDKPKGEVVVALEEVDDRALLRVSDDGPGIAPQYRERIFAAMTTLKPRDEVEGSGMGLAIVKKIARHYKAQISVGQGIGGMGATIGVSFETNA